MVFKNCAIWNLNRIGEIVEAFGIIGMSMGVMGFIFSLSAIDQVNRLKKQLRELGAIPPCEDDC